MDLLDDIRKYLKGRVALEMQYADGMQKLSATFLGHKIANVPDIQTSENDQVRHGKTLATRLKMVKIITMSGNNYGYMPGQYLSKRSG